MDVKEGIVDEKIGNRATPQSDEAPQNPEFLQLCEKVRKESREREAQKLESGGLGHNLDYQICTSTSIATSRYGGKILTPGMWRSCYDIFLCGRLGLYCYNLEKGTNYEFRFVREYSHDYGNHGSLFIVLEAMNPADNSQFVMKTRVRHNNNLAAGLWETCFYLEEDSQEKDHEWDNEAIDDDYEDGEEDDESEDENWYSDSEDEKWNNEALDDQYKGEMPRWLFDVDKQHCYVVEESELKDPDNDWLELFAEFAYFSLYKGQCEQRRT